MSMPEPIKIKVKSYPCLKRRAKDGYFTVYQCNFCSFKVHDQKKVRAHQTRCVKQNE